MRVRLSLFHRDFKALHVPVDLDLLSRTTPPPPDQPPPSKSWPRTDGRTDREIAFSKCLLMQACCRVDDGFADCPQKLHDLSPVRRDIDTSPPPLLVKPWRHMYRRHHCRTLLRGRHCHQYLRRRGRRGGPNPAAGSLEERWYRSRRCPGWRWES